MASTVQAPSVTNTEDPVLPTLVTPPTPAPATTPTGQQDIQQQQGDQTHAGDHCYSQSTSPSSPPLPPVCPPRDSHSQTQTLTQVPPIPHLHELPSLDEVHTALIWVPKGAWADFSKTFAELCHKVAANPESMPVWVSSDFTLIVYSCRYASCSPDSDCVY